MTQGMRDEVGEEPSPEREDHAGVEEDRTGAPAAGGVVADRGARRTSVVRTAAETRRPDRAKAKLVEGSPTRLAAERLDRDAGANPTRAGGRGATAVVGDAPIAEVSAIATPCCSGGELCSPWTRPRSSEPIFWFETASSRRSGRSSMPLGTAKSSRRAAVSSCRDWSTD